MTSGQAIVESNIIEKFFKPDADFLHEIDLVPSHSDIANFRRQYLSIGSTKKQSSIASAWMGVTSSRTLATEAQIVRKLSTPALDPIGVSGTQILADQINKRISELKLFALEENIEIAVQSQKDCEKFLIENNFIFPHIFLLSNGNFRAVWKEAHKQIGVQFLGLWKGQFVMLDGQGLKPNQTLGNNDLTRLVNIAEGAGLGGIWTRNFARLSEYSIIGTGRRRNFEVRAAL